MVQMEVIDLIGQEWKKDEQSGRIQSVETRRSVFAEIDNINRTEFFSAAQTGLKATFKAIIFGGDYNGEDTVERNGKRYYVYRQYSGRGKYKDSVRDDYIELYLQDKAGI